MRISLAAIALALLGTGSALAVSTTMTSFQNVTGGYAGTVDMRISTTGSRDGTTGGPPSTSLLIDGYVPDNPETPGNEASPDEQMLVRFDSIFGNGAGQIPLGATILDAKLQYTTSDSSSADSGGPWGVAALNQPFTSATRYTDFPGGGPIGFRGAWWQDGYATRPQGGFDRTVQGDVENADVRGIVQQWSSDAEGDNNHGFVMQAGWPGVTNGWNFYTTGVGSAPLRPKLSVTYTTDPVAVNTFQRDLNGYTGDTMARLASGDIQTSSATNPDETIDDITYDGYTGARTVSPTYVPPAPPAEEPANPLTDFQIFLDGPTFTAVEGVLNSNDQLALIKFNDVFGNSAEQSPADKEVAKAWLVLTTGDTNNNARSNGTWAAHTMLRTYPRTI